MPETRAVLLDVFDTVLAVDFDAVLNGLVAASGLVREDWIAGLTLHGPDITIGAITPEQAFTSMLRLAGEPRCDIAALLQRDAELLYDHATVYPDVVPFVEEIRRRGMGVAFVSNCAPNAGPLLQALGLADLADEVVLSCSVGSAKPDAGIYQAALDALGVDAGHAVFVDDQAAFCSGAEALGITAVQIDRRDHHPDRVHSLHEVLAMLEGSG